LRNPTAPLSIGLSVWLAIGLFIAAIAVVPGGTAESREPNKTLRLYFSHTGERGEFTFKRNGQFDRSELNRLNNFLRDWRRNEPTRMDPRLFDLVWAIYRESGSHEYIHVVSAYRSLATNNMLRSRSRGVAEHSQHTLGKAMDFYLPDVPLAKLRAIAMKFQVGGVGFYPTSGSPFVHVDVGNPRYWPRMSRQQLMAMFPDGKTLYLPADGKPLAGYQLALAERKSSGGTTLAYLETSSKYQPGSGGRSSGGWLKRVFSGGADEADDDEATTPAAPATAVAAKKPPAEVPVPRIPEVPAAPVEPPATGGPQVLIASIDEGATDARLPRARPDVASEMQLASLRTDLPETAAPTVPAAESTPVAALGFAPMPKRRPDSAILIGSLQEDGASVALEVNAEDAIAALAGRAPAGAPAPQSGGAAQVQVARATQVQESAQPSDADRAILAGFAALDGVPQQSPKAVSALAAAAAMGQGSRAAPLPHPRPVVLAFAAAGLPSDVATPRLPVAAPRPVHTTPSTATVAQVQPAASESEPTHEADAPVLQELIATPTAGARSFAGFAMPQPEGDSSLFTAPQSAADVADPADDPKLPTDHFEVAEAEQESFFSRLFANLAE
jgi:uncharacterized protein YcbK (DUF882 family)